MVRLRGIGSALLVFMLTFTSALFGDVLTTGEQKTFSCKVDSFFVNAGKGIFNVYLITNGQPDEASHPVLADDIHLLEFRPLGDTSETPPGRKAIINLSDGRTFNNFIVEAAGRENDVLTFYIRQEGVTAGGAIHPVPMDRVEKIQFGEIDAASAPTPTPTPVRTPIDPAVNREMEFSMFVPNPEYFDPEQDYEPEGQFASDADLDMDWSGYEEDEDLFSGSRSYGFGPSFLSNSYTIPFIGLAVDILSFLIFIFLATAIGGTFLYMSSNVEDVQDFPIWKAYVTALAITIVSPIAFRIVSMIPIFGFVLGLAAFYFTAHAIIMGAMEVLEDKASSVIITYLVIEVGVLILVVVLLNQFF